MTKKAQDIEFVAGDFVEIVATVVDNDGAVKSLAHCTAEWVLFNERAGVQLFTKMTGAGITITDAVNGVLTVTLQPADTVNVRPGQYYHECEVTDETGKPSTVFIGHVTILPTRV